MEWVTIESASDADTYKPNGDAGVLRKIEDNIERGLDPFQNMGGLVDAYPAVVRACRSGRVALMVIAAFQAAKAAHAAEGSRRGGSVTTLTLERYRMALNAVLTLPVGKV